MKLTLFLIVVGIFVACSGSNITVIGTGYVGLVAGASLADFGHTVCCVDIDAEKIASLNKGTVPFYEPGLAELVQKNTPLGNLSFSTNIRASLTNADIIFLAVGTPMMSDGSADISAVLASIDTIASVLQDGLYRLICIKSTVPIGTTDLINNALLERVSSDTFDVVFNPEFLREGCALRDFAEPERIVIGLGSEKARAIMEEIYAPLKRKGVPFFVTNAVTAETIKYASNAFLAVKISYINEMANLCEKTGAHIYDVAHGMGLDSRIGNKFLTPGPGFGGSCFPKDSHALLKKAEEAHVQLRIVTAALEANDFQKKHVVDKLQSLLRHNLKGQTIAILGLAFKANTDDVRESAAIDVIKQLLAQGATIRAYDPLAMENMKKIMPAIYYASSLQDALADSDAAIILTEWDEFKQIGMSKNQHSYKLPILDTRNILKG
jgi:UDPglucose 6-dehydrogenase